MKLGNTVLLADERQLPSSRRNFSPQPVRVWCLPNQQTHDSQQCICKNRRLQDTRSSGYYRTLFFPAFAGDPIWEFPKMGAAQNRPE